MLRSVQPVDVLPVTNTIDVPHVGANDAAPKVACTAACDTWPVPSAHPTPAAVTGQCTAVVVDVVVAVVVVVVVLVAVDVVAVDVVAVDVVAVDVVAVDVVAVDVVTVIDVMVIVVPVVVVVVFGALVDVNPKLPPHPTPNKGFTPIPTNHVNQNRKNATHRAVNAWFSSSLPSTCETHKEKCHRQTGLL